MDISNYEIFIAPKSSKEQIKLKLNGKLAPYLGDTVEFLITNNGKIFLSHKSSHLDLLSDAGIAEDDILSMGNLSMFVKYGVVVRPKCSDLSGTEFLNDIISKIKDYIEENILN